VKKEVLDVVVVFSSNSNVAPINFAILSTLIEDHIQVMFDLALTRQKEETQTLVNQVMEKQREETRMELQAYAIQQR